MYVYVCITESLYCTPETQINYTSPERKHSMVPPLWCPLHHRDFASCPRPHSGQAESFHSRVRRWTEVQTLGLQCARHVSMSLFGQVGSTPALCCQESTSPHGATGWAWWSHPLCGWGLSTGSQSHREEEADATPAFGKGSVASSGPAEQCLPSGIRHKQLTAARQPHPTYLLL